MTKVNNKNMTIAKFKKNDRKLWAVWFSGVRPNNNLTYEFADLSFLGKGKDFVWMDFMRGKIRKLPSFSKVPVWDSPVLIAPSDVVPRK